MVWGGVCGEAWDRRVGLGGRRGEQGRRRCVFPLDARSCVGFGNCLRQKGLKGFLEGGSMVSEQGEIF